ncbi:hypothetical protein OBBRIDRAFT_839860 [Obba rivulosa]|uniref:Uncharacterized protein n=1 Tax=Obba rivulosa TaxID=1052685 RepID=A0A8E2ALU8_9APHY|nr:hypothetical protein OBBRIDRAFT_839860 [Obba rivulosa]
MEHIELKLIEAEWQRPAPPPEPCAGSDADTPIPTGGNCIVDRMRSLQSARLVVSTMMHLSCDIPTGTPPTSLDVARPFHRLSLQPVPSPLLVASALALPAPPTVTTTSTLGMPPVHSQHALVPTSSLGPPSPASSASSSPRISHFNVAKPLAPAFHAHWHKHRFWPSVADMHSPFVPSKTFPALLLDPAPRPSSTSIPSSMDTFLSRPSSPTRLPLSSTVPRKPFGLSLRTLPSPSPVIPAATPGMEKPELPLTTLFPQTLYEYKNKPYIKVLVLDVRTREELEREHI